MKSHNRIAFHCPLSLRLRRVTSVLSGIGALSIGLNFSNREVLLFCGLDKSH